MKLRVAIIVLAAVGALLLIWFRVVPKPIQPGPHSAPSQPTPVDPPVVVTTIPGGRVERQEVRPPVPTTKLKIELFPHDRRKAPGAQVILLGDHKVMKDIAPGDAEGSSFIELDAVGKNQRIVVIPEDPDLAILVHDVTLTENGPKQISLILQKGMEVSGVVVNSQGQPMASKPVSTEVPVPSDDRPRKEVWAHRVGINVEYMINEEHIDITTATDKQGRFRLVNLPTSVTKVSVTMGKGQVEQFGTGVSLRLVMPDTK
jgi:hypothetical protein